MAVIKKLKFPTPYINEDFNDKTESLWNINRRLYGMGITWNPSTGSYGSIDFTVGAYIVNGLVAEDDAPWSYNLTQTQRNDNIDLATENDPAILLMQTDDDPNTGHDVEIVLESLVGSLDQTHSRIAYYDGTSWTLYQGVAISEILTQLFDETLFGVDHDIDTGYHDLINQKLEGLLRISGTSGGVRDGFIREYNMWNTFGFWAITFNSQWDSNTSEWIPEVDAADEPSFILKIDIGFSSNDEGDLASESGLSVLRWNKIDLEWQLAQIQSLPLASIVKPQLLPSASKDYDPEDLKSGAELVGFDNEESQIPHIQSNDPSDVKNVQQAVDGLNANRDLSGTNFKSVPTDPPSHEVIVKPSRIIYEGKDKQYFLQQKGTEDEGGLSRPEFIPIKDGMKFVEQESLNDIYMFDNITDVYQEAVANDDLTFEMFEDDSKVYYFGSNTTFGRLKATIDVPLEIQEELLNNIKTIEAYLNVEYWDSTAGDWTAVQNLQDETQHIKQHTGTRYRFPLGTVGEDLDITFDNPDTDWAKNDPAGTGTDNYYIRVTIVVDYGTISASAKIDKFIPVGESIDLIAESILGISSDNNIAMYRCSEVNDLGQVGIAGYYNSSKQPFIAIADVVSGKITMIDKIDDAVTLFDNSNSDYFSLSNIIKVGNNFAVAFESRDSGTSTDYHIYEFHEDSGSIVTPLDGDKTLLGSSGYGYNGSVGESNGIALNYHNQTSNYLFMHTGDSTDENILRIEIFSNFNDNAVKDTIKVNGTGVPRYCNILYNSSMGEFGVFYTDNPADDEYGYNVLKAGVLEYDYVNAEFVWSKEPETRKTPVRGIGTNNTKGDPLIPGYYNEYMNEYVILVTGEEDVPGSDNSKRSVIYLNRFDYLANKIGSYLIVTKSEDESHDTYYPWIAYNGENYLISYRNESGASSRYRLVQVSNSGEIQEHTEFNQLDLDDGTWGNQVLNYPANSYIIYNPIYNKYHILRWADATIIGGVYSDIMVSDIKTSDPKNENIEKYDALIMDGNGDYKYISGLRNYNTLAVISDLENNVGSVAAYINKYGARISEYYSFEYTAGAENDLIVNDDGVVNVSAWAISRPILSTDSFDDFNALGDWLINTADSTATGSISIDTGSLKVEFDDSQTGTLIVERGFTTPEDWSAYDLLSINLKAPSSGFVGGDKVKLMINGYSTEWISLEDLTADVFNLIYFDISEFTTKDNVEFVKIVYSITGTASNTHILADYINQINLDVANKAEKINITDITDGTAKLNIPSEYNGAGDSIRFVYDEQLKLDKLLLIDIRAFLKGGRTLREAVISGKTWHGEILPLPEGFSEDECRWTVSTNYQPYALQTTFDGYFCDVDENRQVIQKFTDNPSGTHVEKYGAVNYVVIGRKYI